MKFFNLDARTWQGKQAMAAALAAKLRQGFGQGYRIHKDDARECAELERIANWDKAITADEIAMRVKAGNW